MAILQEQIVPVEREAEPKPESSLLWARWPCDPVPVACWEKTSLVLFLHTCGGGNMEEGERNGRVAKVGMNFREERCLSRIKMCF